MHFIILFFVSKLVIFFLFLLFLIIFFLKNNLYNSYFSLLFFFFFLVMLSYFPSISFSLFIYYYLQILQLISTLRQNLKIETFVKKLTKKCKKRLEILVNEISILENSLAVSFSDSLSLVNGIINNAQ